MPVFRQTFVSVPPSLQTRFFHGIIHGKMSHVTNRESCENFRRSEEANRRREARHLFFLSSLGGAFLFCPDPGIYHVFHAPGVPGNFPRLRPGLFRRLEGWRALGRQLRYLLPVLLFTALLNPLFNHQGATVFLRLPNGSPLTLEAASYGGAAGGHAAGGHCLVPLLWRCDHLRQISLPLRPDGAGLVPAPVHGVSLRAPVPSPYAGGLPGSAGHWRSPEAPAALAAFSATVTWALENAIETADSMRSRGYGLPGSTTFSVYRLTVRDIAVLCSLLALGGLVITGSFLGGTQFQFYPTMWGPLTAPPSLGVFAAFSLLCLFPPAHRPMGGFEMELFIFQDLTFSYPGRPMPLWTDCRFEIPAGSVFW